MAGEVTGVEGSRPQASPRTAVVWAVLDAELRRRGGSDRLRVLDVGGGSGMFAVPLAERGAVVTVVDTSANALATLQRRAADAGVASRVVAMPGDADHLAETLAGESFDLVLCHSILEVVLDPAATTATIASMLAPDGRASILVANQAAAVLNRALAGRFTEALRVAVAGSEGPGGGEGEPAPPVAAGAEGGQPPRHRFDTAALTALLDAAGLVPESLHGVRVVADLVAGSVVDGAAAGAEKLLELEWALAARPPYRDIAAQLHVFARRR